MEHQHWSKEWNNVIWSDEAHFEFLNQRNRILVCRLPSEIDGTFNFSPRVLGSGSHISVCGCLSGEARGSLVIYPGKVDRPAYVKIIEQA